MNAPLHTLSTIQQNIAATQASRARLRSVAQAISGGQFDQAPTADAPQHGAGSPLERSEMMANAMDATFALIQQRVVGDIRGAMHHLDAVARFKTAAAQADYTATHTTTSPAQAHTSGQPHPQGDVVDVQAKDISPSPPPRA
jgi:hypothetical protein